MNFALSDEQVLLREAARGSLARFKTIEAARDALEDPCALPDLWPMAIEAGWPGLLIDEEHGGAGLGAFDAHAGGRGVRSGAGRRSRSSGSMPAAAILDAAGDESLEAVASGELRPAYVPARPPGDQRAAAGRSIRASGLTRPTPRALPSTASQVTLDGEVAFVPDAPGAGLLVAIGVDDDGEPVAAAVDAAADGVDRASRWSATTRPARWRT